LATKIPENAVISARTAKIRTETEDVASRAKQPDTADTNWFTEYGPVDFRNSPGSIAVVDLQLQAYRLRRFDHSWKNVNAVVELTPEASCDSRSYPWN